MIKQLQTALSVVGLTLILVLVGCGSETALDPAESSVADAPASTVGSEPEPDTEETSDGELPVFTKEETWPSDPVIGVWYRLDFRDYAFCGADELLVPNTPSELVYFNNAPSATFRSSLFKHSVDGQVLLGFARLRDDESIDYSHDGSNNITNYQLAAVEDVNLPPCE